MLIPKVTLILDVGCGDGRLAWRSAGGSIKDDEMKG